MVSDNLSSLQIRYPRYGTYVLRLWQETPISPWRVRLQEVGQTQSTNFADIAACFAFIQAQLSETGAQEAGSPDDAAKSSGLKEVTQDKD